MKTSRLPLAASLLAVLVLPATLCAATETETVNGIEWTYTVSNGKASVGGGSSSSPAVPKSTSGAITIPSMLGGYPVTRIGEDAFTYCEGLTSVTIPNGVTSIGRGAFIACRSLKSVTIPNSVTRIGVSAFEVCPLTTITFPVGLQSIGGWAFWYCWGLRTVIIPPNVTSIGTEAFDNCFLRKMYLPIRFKGHTGSLGNLGSCAFVFYSGNTPPYIVAFSANGGKLTKDKTMTSQTMVYGKVAKLRKNVFKRQGYVFAGWAKSKANAKKGVIDFTNAQRVKNLTAKGGTTTLYAVWAKKTYKVAFYANGGKGKMAVEKFTYGKAKKLSANKFTRKGYIFKGWAKSKALAKKGKVAYKNKKSVKNLVKNGTTVKLFAVWEKK